MNALYTKLLKYVPPPKSPEGKGTPAVWAKAEQRLGIQFPDEYRWIFDTYGYGQFGDLRIYSALAQSDFNNESEIEFQIRMYQENFAEKVRSGSSEYTLTDKNRTFETRLAVWPNHPGLFPLGRDGSGDLYTYHTHHDDPNRWTVAESDMHYYFDTNLTLVNYLIRMIENPIIPGRMNEGSIFRYFEEKYQKAKYFPFCNGTYDHDIFHWT